MIRSFQKQKPIRLKGKAKDEFRTKIGLANNETCCDCNRYAPLKGATIFDIGHLAHIKGYGAGGGDTEDNVKWKCYWCHIGIEHGLRWSKKV
jgi:hypothetical protein